MLLEKQAQLPEIRDTDTKESFLYAAIVNKAQSELILKFDTLAEHIERGLKRPQ